MRIPSAERARRTVDLEGLLRHIFEPFLVTLQPGDDIYFHLLLRILSQFKMTTAARPTFDPAKGGACVQDRDIKNISHQVSSRDLPAHLTLKGRLHGQDTTEEIQSRDLKAELEERERIAQVEKSKQPSFKLVPSLEQATQVRLALKAERDRERVSQKEALLSESADEVLSQSMPNLVNARKMAQLDKDEDFGSDNNLSESDFEDDDDDEDNPEELMAELNRIKQERLAEEKKREKEQKLKEERVRSKIDNDDDDRSSTFSVKRRWDHDVPFKNCARDAPDAKRKLYTNDTLRQEFHRRFMDKYIR